MFEDPIIEELHKIREQIAAESNYDLRAMVAAMHERHKDENRVYVSPPPKLQLPALAEVKERVSEFSAREQSAGLTQEEKEELDDLLSLAKLERLACERLKAAVTQAAHTPLIEKLAA